VLRGIFGSKRDEATGESRKLNNEELHDLYSSPNTVRVIKPRMRWAGHVVWIGEERGVYRVFDFRILRQCIISMCYQCPSVTGTLSGSNEET
jgi:hypothetical protein